MIEPLISVVIPVYNRKDSILDCIDSVLNQTYKNIELVIVDDFSSDGSSTVVGSICDSRIRLFTLNRNYGACYSRNYGVDQCRGEFVAFQDSDDIWYPEKLRTQFEYLLAENLDLVFCSMLRTEGKRAQIYPSPAIMKLIPPQYYKEVFLYENIASTQTILAHRSVFLLERFDSSLHRYQDWDVMIRISLKYKIGFLENVLVESALSSNSLSRNHAEGINSLQFFLLKYSIQYDLFPEHRARLYEKIGDLKVLINIDANNDYYNSIKSFFIPKVYIKYILTKCRLRFLFQIIWNI